VNSRAADDDQPIEAGPDSPVADRRLELAEAAFKLKDELRGGWLLRGVTDPESVAAHSWGTAFLCLLYATEAGVESDRAVTMALVHDLAEAETGDVVTRADASDRVVTEDSKARLEAEAIDRLLLQDFDDLRSEWRAYEDRSDAVALFVRDMNLIDMCMQAVIYQEQRRYDPELVIPSRGGFTHLDEFFASAAGRLGTPLGRRLFAALEARYRASR